MGHPELDPAPDDEAHWHGETPDLPLTFPATGRWVTTSDGVQRQLKAYAMKAKSNGAAGSDLVASGGTVTFTRMDPGPGSYEGSYDVRFGRGRVTGGFGAPWC